MEDQFWSSRNRIRTALSGLRLLRGFHGPSRKWETTEVDIPALLPVRPGAEGSERYRLVDRWKPDIAFGDGGAERGVKGPPHYPDRYASVY